MTESEWLEATDPAGMLGHLGREPSPRKLRLYACHWARLFARPSSEPECWLAIEAAEQYADGEINIHELTTAHRAVRQLLEQDCFAKHGHFAKKHGYLYRQRGVHQAAADAASPFGSSAYRTRWGNAAQRVAACGFLRDLFGNLFHPVAVDDTWLSWNGGLVPRLSQAIYNDRTFDHLPILADALEEAGCCDAAILEHCRGPGPHGRGCWVVDLLLGKE